ncbi:MAG: hypothetical protein QOE54_6507 [Streptosporangiaceae bacterium]|jgi:hypothetical protein|nr:hypothetical protein [Streptosporangiaceae bacterium]MDX6434141.1 hypothetical protein [Streptosporangiaceae bacterium]
MKMRRHMAVTLSALAFVGGTALAGGSAFAATPASAQNATLAPYGAASGGLGVANLRPTCRWMKGHWQYKHVGRRIVKTWVPGHKVCPSKTRPR